MIKQLYMELLDLHGPQGWWPLLRKGRDGYRSEYFPGDFGKRSERERFEICAGAILTQNTSWMQAEKALAALKEKGILSPEKIISARAGSLSGAIRAAGYFNQKARKLKEFARFVQAAPMPTREQLLSVWGIGNETADSMLLYAYRVPTFVVDKYTQRLFAELGITAPEEGYSRIKLLVEKEMQADHKAYNEFHALIVRHQKQCRPPCQVMAKLK
ncbi:endonuclease III domain-containing protein [Candidatus Woesearchaeota archaeon]|nr:endonuclease III domain-containing protein [Candidatus Woesearchaeota archaeon]